MPLETGEVINNRYRIVSLLGQGGFGAVYQAWDLSLKRPCAVKENLDTAPEVQRQFIREATILAGLVHANLPRVTDYFRVPGQGQFLVMDFIEGEDLEHLVARQGRAAVGQALDWIGQVADALNYLHTRPTPVVHRDIKPANIRITPQGKAVLVDFGLVKEVDPHLRTTVGARAVTPGYSPPEQYGQRSTDARSDIYALAATLYTLLTGQAPPESVLRSIRDTLVPVEALNPAVPPAVATAIRQALALEPDRRIQTAGEFRAYLQADQAGPARPESRLPEVRPARRLPWAPVGLGAFALVLVLAWYWLGRPPHRPALETAQATTPVAAAFATGEAGMASARLTATAPLAPTATASNTPTAEPTPPDPTATETPAPPARIDAYDLAFASDREGSWRTYLMDPEEPLQTLGLDAPKKYDLAWWPTFCGDSVAVEVKDSTGQNPGWIYYLYPGGGADRLKSTVAADFLGVPRCSPDGSYLGFSAHESNWSFYLQDRRSRAETWIYSAAIAGYASWPLGGAPIYSMKYEEGASYTALRTSGFPGSPSTASQVEGGTYPAVSPDGRTLAYIPNRQAYIRVIDLSSGRQILRQNITLKKVENVLLPASLMFSGDGAWIYYASAADGDWDIYRVKLDGSAPENLTNDWGGTNEIMPAVQW